MRRQVYWGALVVITALVQTTWLDALRVEGVLPDLILLLIVYAAIAAGEESAMAIGVLGGIYQDVAGDAVLGHYVLCNAVVGYAAGKLARRLLSEHPAVKVALTFGAALLHGVLFTAVSYVQDPNLMVMRTIFSSVVPGAFYTALMTPFVFFLISWLFREKRRVQGDAV